MGEEPDKDRFGGLPSREPNFDDLRWFLQWLSEQPFWASYDPERVEQLPPLKPSKEWELTIPKPSSRRSEDYYEVRMHFNRKVIALLVFMFLALSRLFEAIGYDLIRSAL